MSDRDELLKLAYAHDWRIVHDFGLHVQLERRSGRRPLALQFDHDGRLTWASRSWAHLSPLDYARIVLTTRKSSPGGDASAIPGPVLDTISSQRRDR
jgi:hypothetical protein